MSRSQRIYRALLKVCPEDFRREYGVQMEQVFGDLYREARERGGRRAIALMWALTISTWHERRRRRGSRPARTMRR